MPMSESANHYLRHPSLRADRGIPRAGSRVECTYRTTTRPTRLYSYASHGPGGEISLHHFIIHLNESRVRNDMLREPANRVPTRTEYAPYWKWLAALGLAATGIGIIIGASWPGPLTGVVFPIGITILLVVAYGARARELTASNAR